MARIAIPTWNNRVSPVFDAAGKLLVVDIKDNTVCSKFETEIIGDHFPVKVIKLKELQIDTLICGAISMPLFYMIKNIGVNVIPWVSGMTEDILRAFLDETLFQFLMPGSRTYRGGRHGRRHGQQRGRGENFNSK